MSSSDSGISIQVTVVPVDVRPVADFRVDAWHAPLATPDDIRASCLSAIWDRVEAIADTGPIRCAQCRRSYEITDGSIRWAHATINHIAFAIDMLASRHVYCLVVLSCGTETCDDAIAARLYGFMHGAARHLMHAHVSDSVDSTQPCA